jgi:hypothetical protein
VDGGGISLNMSVKPENIVYTAEQRQRHLDWLRQEKKLFLRTYREIGSFLKDYSKEGEWL